MKIDSNCQIVGNRAGVFIGTGLELTNRTTDELISLGIDKALVTKI